MTATTLTATDRRAGVVLVAAGIAFQVLWLGLPASLVSVGLVISLGLWLGTSWRITPGLRLVFALAVLVFAGHAAEELFGGLHRALPALFDREPWSAVRFLVFNGVWAVVFLAAALTVNATRALPVLIILFLAVVGGVANGVIHLLLVAQRGEYFPGALTAPLCLVMGVWLLRLLYPATPPPESS